MPTEFYVCMVITWALCIGLSICILYHVETVSKQVERLQHLVKSDLETINDNVGSICNFHARNSRAERKAAEARMKVYQGDGDSNADS